MTKWSGIRLWAVLLFAGLTMVAGVAPAAADTGCSTVAVSLATLNSFAAEAGGNGCVQAAGGTQFSDWSYSTSGNAALFNASAVNVTPLVLNGNAGIQIQGGFTTTTNMDVIIQFEVSGAGPYTDAHLDLIAGAGDPGSSGTIAETIRAGGTETPASCEVVHCLPGVYDVDGPVVGNLFVSIAGAHSVFTTFAGESELVITKDIHIACPTESTSPCTVSISDFNQAFSTTPEPATLLLLGSGLAGAGIFGRRRLKKARA